MMMNDVYCVFILYQLIVDLMTHLDHPSFQGWCGPFSIVYLDGIGYQDQIVDYMTHDVSLWQFYIVLKIAQMKFHH